MGIQIQPHRAVKKVSQKTPLITAQKTQPALKKKRAKRKRTEYDRRRSTYKVQLKQESYLKIFREERQEEAR